MFGKETTQKLGMQIAMSDDMQRAIERWALMYQGKSPWLDHNLKNMRLPAQIASEMATMVALEAVMKISGSPRADWLLEQCKPVMENLQTNVEYACAYGGLVFKPYVDGKDVAVDFVLADDFYPTAFNSRKEIVGAVFVERKQVGNKVYTRLEIHNKTDDAYVIQNKAYKGTSEDDLSQEVPLQSVDEWASLQEEVSIGGIDFPLFAYLRIPLGNTVDPKSPVGVSVFEKATPAIQEADEQYQRLIWEYRGGEMAIDAVEDAFDIDPKTKKPILPAGEERLYRPNKLDPKHVDADSLFKTFAPTLRDSSYLAGLNKQLQVVEDLSGLSRGTFSDPNQDARTAQEIKMQKQRTASMVTNIQKATQKALESLVKAVDAIATLYGLAPVGKYETAFVWDDSVVIDAESERMRNMEEVRQGLMKDWEYRMIWRGEDAETAKRMCQREEESDDDIMGFKKKE